MLARQGVVTLVEMGGEDCVSIVGKLIQPIKGELFSRSRAEPSQAEPTQVS
jgi:hypothetical protein